MRLESSLLYPILLPPNFLKSGLLYFPLLEEGTTFNTRYQTSLGIERQQFKSWLSSFSLCHLGQVIWSFRVCLVLCKMRMLRMINKGPSVSVSCDFRRMRWTRLPTPVKRLDFHGTLCHHHLLASVSIRQCLWLQTTEIGYLEQNRHLLEGYQGLAPGTICSRYPTRVDPIPFLCHAPSLFVSLAQGSESWARG